MIGFVLAAGDGTRMRPLSDERPKPLIPTLGVPQVSWNLAGLAEAGISGAIVNASSASDEVFATVTKDAETLGISVITSHEPSGPLGTAGALKKMQEDLSDPFVVINADVACDVPISGLVDAHRESGATATFLAIPTETHADFVIEESWITELIDRRKEQAWGHLYGGMSIFNRDTLGFIKDEPAGLFETVFKGLLAEDAGLAAFEWDGYWLGIDTPAQHLQVNLDALTGIFPARGIPERLGVTLRADRGSLIGEGTTDEADIRHCVIGAGVRIDRDVTLERCVVWDGTDVPKGTFVDSILTPQQTVSATN